MLEGLLWFGLDVCMFEGCDCVDCVVMFFVSHYLSIRDELCVIGVLGISAEG